jgi:hypothetical protein
LERFAEIRRLLPAPAPARLLELQEEFMSFKDFVKRRFMDTEVEPAPDSRDRDSLWERLWEGLETELPPWWREVALEAQAALRRAPDSPESMDAALDGLSLSVLCDEAERFGSLFIAEYFRRYDTVKGVEMLWRARIQGADEGILDALCGRRREAALFSALRRNGEEEWPELIGRALEGVSEDSLSGETGPKRAAAFVRAADSWLMEFVRAARYVAFGPERVFGYLVGFRAECRNLSVALGGRAAGLDGAKLRQRLQACYA